ncbi:glycosyltransferase family 4 protein [Camelimonas fluminis]|uniref:Glycosyltransferase family 4 protein n=1 Tax=Camelimonas fluminis TaxID=1576911 RepID=A0ABV7UG34_9HYPH|nr:glycosyltransferase family 4 protein [Camelimonas fluminis]
MKLLVLTRYGRLGASSRLRMMQYLPAFKAAGICTEVQSLLDDNYLLSIYSQSISLAQVARNYWSRFRRLRQAERPDVIWLEKELLPWFPATLERLLLPRGVPVVSDYDDAIFHNYDLHRGMMLRVVLGRKIDRVMARSALVMAGNPYLADRAHKAGATWVEIVPTVVDADAYDTSPRREVDGRPRIGWIGSPSTWTQYMLPMLPMLSNLAERYGAALRVVGAGPRAEGNGIENLPWSEEGESGLIQSMDIGLMPLDDSPWSRGKCGYKIIQYMACGLPVVASPVGVNAEIVEDGVTGFLATTETEWGTAIGRLLSDPDLRHRMGMAGRRRMEEHYSLQIWGPRVASMLRKVAEQ